MSGWLDAANVSNKLKQSYVLGFIDVSGGNIINRTGDLLIQNDTSLNNRLFVKNDTSLNGNLYVFQKSTQAGDVNLLSKLTVGTTGYTLTVAGGIPTWKPPYVRTSFTATAGQTSFTATYNVGYVQVFMNGVLLNAADYTASSGTAVVLAVAASVGDILETIAYNV
jgi:hypothetical protein